MGGRTNEKKTTTTNAQIQRPLLVPRRFLRRLVCFASHCLVVARLQSKPTFNLDRRPKCEARGQCRCCTDRPIRRLTISHLVSDNRSLIIIYQCVPVDCPNARSITQCKNEACVCACTRTRGPPAIACGRPMLDLDQSDEKKRKHVQLKTLLENIRTCCIHIDIRQIRLAINHLLESLSACAVPNIAARNNGH